MSIEFERFEAATKKAGLKMRKQAAFAKVIVGKRAVYVALTQKVSRVDLSGFTIKHSAVHQLSDKDRANGKWGRIQGQLDFSKPDERVLEAYSTALTRMKQLGTETETEAKPRKAKAKRTARKAAPTSSTETPAQANA